MNSPQNITSITITPDMVERLEGITKKLRTKDASQPYAPLRLETAGSPAKIENISITGAVDLASGEFNAGGGLHCNIAFWSDDPEMLPPELHDNIMSLHELALSGEPGKPNRMSVSVGREFDTAVYTFTDDLGREHEIMGQMKGRPSLGADIDGASISWKIAAVLTGEQAGRIAESIRREIYLRIEHIQPDMFADAVTKRGQ